MSTKTIRLTPGQQRLLMNLIDKEVVRIIHIEEDDKRLITLSSIKRKLEKVAINAVYSSGDAQSREKLCDSKESANV